MSADIELQIAELQVMSDTHGQLARLHEALNGCEQLLIEDRDTQAEEIARTSWHYTQKVRALFLTWPASDEVARLLESIEAAADSCLTWLGIIEHKVPGWSAHRRRLARPYPRMGDNPHE